MIRSIVLGANTWLADIPAVNGVSDTLNPTNIVVCCAGPDYYVINKIDFGTYAQVNDEPDPASGLIQKTTGAIALHPVGNKQGSYYFMSLTAGEHLKDLYLTKISAAKGIRIFGGKGIQAVLSEFSQLDEKGVVEPLDPNIFPFQQKKDALCMLSFLRESRCGHLKYRT